ncbi:MAG: ABC transporter permease [Anaerolineae bacterium]|nr:ABC transporter permease [Anaerolineae bacterium]
MSLYLRLAWRNMLRHKRRSLIVFLSVGLGMMLMMFYDGFVAGFEDAIYANAIKILGGNIQAHAAGYSEQSDTNPILPLAEDGEIMAAAQALPQVQAASRRITTAGLASSREGAFSVSITGIEPELELAVSLSAQNLVDGRFLSATDQDVVYIGKGLADAMDVGVGDHITLVGQASHEQMRQRTMTVAGIYDIGIPDIEKRTIYISLAEAQALYNLNGGSTEVMISLKRLGREPQVLEALRAQFPSNEIDSWENNFPEMQSAINTKGGVMDIISVIILAIAGIGILNLLMMAVYERTREIGILGAIGMKPGQITLLFLLEGALMGVFGLVFGIALGLALNLILGRIGFDYSQFSSLTEYTALISGRVYPTLGVDKLLQRGLTVVVIAILAAYYPAREAARRDPAQALHYV